VLGFRRSGIDSRSSKPCSNASSSGSFANVTGLSIGGGKQFQVDANADNLTLTVVAQ